MAVHISTQQVVDHIKTAKKISVDGIIYEDITFNTTNFKVDEYIFPYDYFDIGGMDHNSLILVDKSHAWRRVQFHEADGTTINHPTWKSEEYDNALVRNREIVAIANQTKFTK